MDEPTYVDERDTEDARPTERALWCLVVAARPHADAELHARALEQLSASSVGDPDRFGLTMAAAASGHPGWLSAEVCREECHNGLRKEWVNLMTVHLFSSCRPGEAQASTATDSFGRVRGVENVIVADASQIPEAPGVNPQGTVMALAYRAAEAFVARGEQTRRTAAAREDYAE